MNLSGADNATISDASGDGTITNDDAKPTLAINDVTKAEGDSGTTSFTFTVTKTGATAVTATVNWATAAGTATAGTSCTTGVDYITDSDTLSFGAAETSKSITVLVCGEAVYEADQTFLVNLSGASHATIDDAQGVGTITNDDAKPTLAINDVTAAEGDLPGSTTFTFTVTKSGLTELSASVNWATADDTALGDAACDAGVDYLDASGSLTFAANDASETIEVTVCRDNVYELDDLFNVNLSDANNATISDASGDGTITNDDAKPTLAINDVTKAEGDSGTTSFTFTVTKTGATAVTATVNWATAAGTATAGTSCTTGVDYITDSDTLSFGAAETSKSITVLVCGEAVYEADQTFFVNLSGASHATIDDAQGVGTITNDDAKPTLAINDVTAAEGDLPGTTTFTFTVTKSGLTELSASVNWATADDTALGDAACDAGVDYLDASGSLTFAANDASETIEVTVCRDNVYELDDLFNVNLSSASNATISDASGDGTITNDDAKPTLAINDVTKAEGDSGTTSFTFTVTKTGATAVTATVNWATAAGTATAGTSCTTGVDYITDSDTLSFGAAETSKSITVLVCGEAVYEADQTFLVNLSGASHATIDDAQGVGTITNDDAKPTLAINDVTAAEGDLPGSTTFTFTVTKSGLTELSASVNWATADDTALGDAACDAGVDYLDASGSLTFAANDASETIEVTVCRDNVYELDDLFNVNLSGASDATISDASGDGTITNDDAKPTLAINDVTKAEGDSGTTSFTFTVTKTGATAVTATVNWATAAGTATAGTSCTTGVDYITDCGQPELRRRRDLQDHHRAGVRRQPRRDG